jgi:hypothetical protein
MTKPYAERVTGDVRERKRERDRQRRAEQRQQRDALEVLRALLCPKKGRR